MTDEQKAALDLAILNLRTHGDDQLLSAVKPLIEFYESRVLAERKPAMWVILDKDGDLVGQSMTPMKGLDWQPLFTHPTPDDALDAARYRFLKAGAELSKWNGGWSSYWLIKSVDIPDGRNDMTLDAAIDRAMQSGEEGKS